MTDKERRKPGYLEPQLDTRYSENVEIVLASNETGNEASIPFIFELRPDGSVTASWRDFHVCSITYDSGAESFLPRVGSEGGGANNLPEAHLARINKAFHQLIAVEEVKNRFFPSAGEEPADERAFDPT